MNDIDIKLIFGRIRGAGDLPPNLVKLFKGLRSWHRKTGGLSEKQINLLMDIERRVTANMAVAKEVKAQTKN